MIDEPLVVHEVRDVVGASNAIAAAGSQLLSSEVLSIDNVEMIYIAKVIFGCFAALAPGIERVEIVVSQLRTPEMTAKAS